MRRGEKTETKELSLAEDVQKNRASRMHEMLRVSAERDENNSRISLPFFFSVSFFLRVEDWEKRVRRVDRR